MTSSRALILTLCLAARLAQAHALEPTRLIVTCQADSSLEDCLSQAQASGGDAVRVLPLIHAVVVEIPPARLFAAQEALASSASVERTDPDPKVRWLKSLPDFTIPVPDLRELKKNLSEIRKPDAAGSYSEIPWGVRRVGAEAAWARTRGEGSAIAVIDTGIDDSHPDLAGQVAGGFNALSPDRPQSWRDDEGHGTHVAGTIAAKRDGRGVVGVAPGAKLYAVKVLDKNGSGRYSDVIAGIEWAASRGIRIANMSLGSAEGSEPLHRAVKAALKAGLLIIAAAGNSGGAVDFPGAYPETLAVAASDENDLVADFSSRGPQVNFIAPGVDILSTKMGGGYVRFSGTSMATPHVAGLAALAESVGATSPSAIRAALASAAKPLAGLTSAMQGRGMVLAGNLVNPKSRRDESGERLASLTR